MSWAGKTPTADDWRDILEKHALWLRARQSGQYANLEGANLQAWIETPAGRYVEAEVTRLALEDLRAGDRRGEINLYLALVRRASRGLTPDAAGYVCNNSHRSLLARRLMERVPELAGYFRTRELRGRDA